MENSFNFKHLFYVALFPVKILNNETRGCCKKLLIVHYDHLHTQLFVEPGVCLILL